MEDNKVTVPIVWEDPKTGYLLLQLEARHNEERDDLTFLGIDLLRGNKDAISRNYINKSDAKQARRSDIYDALRLNRKQIRKIIYQAKQIAAIYDQHEICLFPENERMNPNLITVSAKGCTDLNNWEEASHE